MGWTTKFADEKHHKSQNWNYLSRVKLKLLTCQCEYWNHWPRHCHTATSLSYFGINFTRWRHC